MAEDAKEGLAAAVDLLMGQTQAGTGARAAEQLALLPSASAVEDASADDEAAERSGPGRPPGSRNKRTQDWVDFIGARYRSPLLFLAETFTRPVELLARELGTTKLEAFKLQVDAAKNLAPFVHQKQPLAVQVSASGEVLLTIVAPGVSAPGDGAKLLEAEVVPTSEENQ